MNTKEIVDTVRTAIDKSLRDSIKFQGIAKSIEENPKIKPEYLISVNLAHEFSKHTASGERIVELEPLARDLKKTPKIYAICDIHNRRSKTRTTPKRIKTAASSINQIKFGSINSQRFDLSIIDTTSKDRILIIEAKKSLSSFSSIKLDIDKLLKIVEAYDISGAFRYETIYFCCAFYSLEEKISKDRFEAKNRKNIQRIVEYFKDKSNTYSWLFHRCGMVRGSYQGRDTAGERIHYEDDQYEDVFLTHNYHYQPGMLIFGNKPDIKRSNLQM
ncbi:hypothetical protein [Thalassospira sp. MCCC 1A03138]|uniref:hypothetical protein n=1 Tax=Thalassospira sp. MCCC 1A03138 TaxID=1470576 RepID=UPI000A1FA5C7|nr:hypothetical protein [Thalassospira sp. MCCC 1A03138]OSQ29585.1 hypothetical protein TH468_15845 [Thalassospira sp. MCCC 1A03138]